MNSSPPFTPQRFGCKLKALLKPSTRWQTLGSVLKGLWRLALLHTSAVFKQASGLFGYCGVLVLRKLRFVKWKC